eukprot:gene23550-9075_t
MDLVFNAATVHRMYNDPHMVQRCTLLSIKTGGCPENCNYCSQSSSWSKDTGMKAEKLMDLDSVYEEKSEKLMDLDSVYEALLGLGSQASATQLVHVQSHDLLELSYQGPKQFCLRARGLVPATKSALSWRNMLLLGLGSQAALACALRDMYFCVLSLQSALRSREPGSTRLLLLELGSPAALASAWEQLGGGPLRLGTGGSMVLDMGLGMEVCTTLGMLTPEQAKQLREAGLTAYNHNLDTSPEFYEKVTTTRKYEDRLETLENVRLAGISVCAGGIIGLGEGEKDRVGLMHQLATLPAHPESVPINRLVAIKGTPMQSVPINRLVAIKGTPMQSVPINRLVAIKGTPMQDLKSPTGLDLDLKSPTGLDLVRCIATARIVMPRTVVRLSAGRLNLTMADQALAFLAGANSIFDGDKLLTTKNNDRNEDMEMFELLGLRSRPAFMPYSSGNESSSTFPKQAPSMVPPPAPQAPSATATATA